MNKYKNSKVYKIINDVNENIYVGATTLKYLCSRLAQHKSQARTGKQVSFFYSEMEKVGVEHFSIVLLESADCTTINELNAREQHWIDTLKPYYNRRQVEGLDPKKISIRNRIFRENNKDLISAYHKTYTQQNKDAIKARRHEKTVCECGCEVLYSGMLRHKKSLKHIKYIQDRNNV